MSDLLSRVLAATGPDRGLFIEVMRALGINAQWREDNGKAANDDALLWERVVDLADNDASLDAARALRDRVPWIVGTKIVERDGSCDVHVWGEDDAGIDIISERDDNQVALALIAAILKAKEARDGGVV